MYAGHAIQGCGDWSLQDDVFTFDKFASICRESDVENALKQQQGGTFNIVTFGEGPWNNGHIGKLNIGKILDVKVNPEEKISDFDGITMFSQYLSTQINVKSVKELLKSSDVVGNIRFSKPTLYVFPGSQGDSALFGISGFNLLINGGYNRKASFWDFTRHLDRIDAILLTHLGVDNMFGINAVLERKAHENVHPEVGYIYMNAVEKSKHSPNGDIQPENGGSHKHSSLLVNLVEEGNKLMENLRLLGQVPHPCIGNIVGSTIEPLNLYHKVGHGSLDMYVLNPVKDSKELKEMFGQWNKHVDSFSCSKSVLKVSGKDAAIPLPNMCSVSCLLVWRPSSPIEMITRILFPGNAPQHKIFEGLDKLKNQDIFQQFTCCENNLKAPKPMKKTAIGKASARAKATPPPSTAERKAPEKKPMKSTQPKTTKEEKNSKKAAASKKTSTATTPSDTKSRTPVETPTPTKSTPIQTPDKTSPTPPEIPVNPIDTLLQPNGIEPVETGPTEPILQTQEPSPIQAANDLMSGVPEPVDIAIVKEEPVPANVMPEPVDIAMVKEEPVEAKVKEEPSTELVKEDPPTELIKEEPPTELVKEEPPTELVNEETPTELVKDEPPTELVKEEPPTEPAQEVVEFRSAQEMEVDPSHIKLEPANTESDKDIIDDIAPEGQYNATVEESAMPEADQPLIESPEPLPDPAHFDSAPFERPEFPHPDIPPVVDAKPFDEKPVAEPDEQEEISATSPIAESTSLLHQQPELQPQTVTQGLASPVDLLTPSDTKEEPILSQEQPIFSPQQQEANGPMPQLDMEHEQQPPAEVIPQDNVITENKPDLLVDTQASDSGLSHSLMEHLSYDDQPEAIQGEVDTSDHLDDEQEMAVVAAAVEAVDDTALLMPSVLHPHDLPEDQQLADKYHADPEVDQQVFGGACPEGLPEPTEPHLPMPDSLLEPVSKYEPGDVAAQLAVSDAASGSDRTEESTPQASSPEVEPCVMPTEEIGQPTVMSPTVDPHQEARETSQEPAESLPDSLVGEAAGMDEQNDNGFSCLDPLAEPFMPHQAISVNPFEIADGPQGGVVVSPEQQVTNPFFGVSQQQQQAANPFDFASDPTLPTDQLVADLESVDRDSLEKEEFDPLKQWGEPMGLPAPPGGDIPAPKKGTSATAKKEAAKKTTSGVKKTTDMKKPASATARTGTKKPAATTNASAKPAATKIKKEPVDTKTARKTSPRERLGTPKKDAVSDKLKNGNVKEPAAGKKPLTTTVKKTARPASSPAASNPTKTRGPVGRRPATATSVKSAPTAKSIPPTPVVPFYVDLTYVPHHGDAHYVDIDFFRRVRARYYVISALNPNPNVLNALLEAKQTWENPDTEVTIIPTYDTETLRYWMGLHRDQLSQYKINVAPSASRCTIQLQDHETSCAAYRLEF